METPPVGSLAVPSPKYRDSMSTGEGAGILMSLRRSSGHLYYPSTGRSFWVPLRQVSGIPPEAVPEGCLERLVSELLLFLKAEECELVEIGQRHLRLSVETARITAEQLEHLRRMLGDRLESYAFEAGSMRALVMRLSLTGLPDAAATPEPGPP